MLLLVLLLDSFIAGVADAASCPEGLPAPVPLPIEPILERVDLGAQLLLALLLTLLGVQDGSTTPTRFGATRWQSIEEAVGITQRHVRSGIVALFPRTGSVIPLKVCMLPFQACVQHVQEPGAVGLTLL